MTQAVPVPGLSTRAAAVVDVTASELLPLGQLGARERTAEPGVVDFGALFPGVTPADGQLVVRIIHDQDQFIADIPPVRVELSHGSVDGVGELWTGSVDTNDKALAPKSKHWGTDGEQRYIYRYALERPDGNVIDDIIDPFAREYGVGDLSAITVRYQAFLFHAATEAIFTVPSITDAIVYELNIAEFGGDIDKSIQLLDYLADLGVNVIEVMPVSNVASRIDWGYAPIGYFGVDERLGKRRDFQRLVAEAHRRGIAVVVDAVFGHVEDRFPYHRLYQALGRPSPMIGAYSEDLFFQSTDFAKPLTRQFFLTVCSHWLETFHVDGFRYDAVSQYWDQARPGGERGFEDLARAVGALVEDGRARRDHFTRFFASADGERRLLQIAEYLTQANPAEHVLFDTVANSAWQNQTMDAAKHCAEGRPGAIAELGLRLGLVNFPATREHDGITITKSALQYTETHDHERFICNYGTHFPDRDSEARGDDLLRVGNRAQSWFKTQPYLIGLLTARGTPFLWAGQEFCQDYFVPDKGVGRVAIYRPIDFNYFYDVPGKALIRLVRRLTRIRHAEPQLRGNEHFFFNRAEYTGEGLLVFQRGDPSKPGRFSLVALNFTDRERSASFTFPRSGDYAELIEGGDRNLNGVVKGVPHRFSVPSNYGCIWTHPG